MQEEISNFNNLNIVFFFFKTLDEVHHFLAPDSLIKKISKRVSFCSLFFLFAVSLDTIPWKLELMHQN